MRFTQAKGPHSALRRWRPTRLFLSKILVTTFILGLFSATVYAGFFSYGLYGYGLNRADAQEDLTPEQQAALRQQLQEIEAEIAKQQTILDQKKTEGQSITRDISILNAQIKQAQLKIQAHAIAIKNLGKDITVKTNTITALNGRIDKSKESLSQILQRTREIDNYSMAEALLSSKNISDFFIDLDTYTSIKQSMQDHLDEIKSDKQQNENAKQELDQKRNQEIDTKVNIEHEQAVIKKAEGDKQNLLSLNKNEQKGYQTSIANKQAQAAKIRNQLFSLRDSAAIKFGDAVNYAKTVASKTGVDPAFLLAIIQQESNLGANVGQCYLTDPATGVGIRKSSGTPIASVMKPTRDVQPFLQITGALGRDPYKTVVSCPQSVGYGGAMGPAQFIPSTWVLFKGRLSSALGKSEPDPWNPLDALMASGFYLTDLGAIGSSYTGQIRAACKYYGSGGSTCSYGRSVMTRVQAIQANIDIIQAN